MTVSRSWCRAPRAARDHILVKLIKTSGIPPVRGGGGRQEKQGRARGRTVKGREQMAGRVLGGWREGSAAVAETGGSEAVLTVKTKTLCSTYKDSVRTSHRTHCASIRKICW